MIDKRMWASQTPLRLAEGGEEGPDAMAFNSRFAILSHGVVLAPVSGSPATNVGHEDSGWVFLGTLAGLCMGALLRSLQFGDW